MRVLIPMLSVALGACSPSLDEPLPDGAGGDGAIPQGELAHGRSFTLQRPAGGFGTRPATLRFDDARGSSPQDTWDFAIPTPAHNGAYAISYRTPAEVTALKASGVAPELPHRHVDRNLAGAHFADDEASNFYSWNVAVGLDRQESVTRSYASYYMRIDPQWTFRFVEGPEGDHNFKEGQLAAGSGPWGTDGTNWYYNLMGIDQPEVTLAFNPETLADQFFDVDDMVVEWFRDTGAVFSRRSFPSPHAAWVKLEFLLEHDAQSGLHRVLANNVAQWDVRIDDDNDALPTGRSRTVAGGYAREDGTTDPYRNNFRYYCDVYYDPTWARVMLADSEDYARATIIEPQPILRWTDTEIEVSGNLGRIAGSTGYLHVFDADSQPIAVYPIAIAP